MPPKIQKSKAAKLLAAQSSSKSKGKKKKWSKGKLREKKNNRVVFTKDLYQKFLVDVPKKLKVITIYNLVENFKINCSLARRGIRELLAKGTITPVVPSGTYAVYTKSAKAAADEAAAKKASAAKEGDKKKQPQQKKGGKKAAAAEAEEADE